MELWVLAIMIGSGLAAIYLAIIGVQMQLDSNRIKRDIERERREADITFTLIITGDDRPFDQERD